MKLTILGSGTYQPELEKHSSAYLIETKGSKICFDFGRGAIDQLLKLGIYISQIDAIFISHWHSDHITDLIPLLHYTTAPLSDEISVLINRKKPLKIYGPEGTLENIKEIIKIIRYGEESLDNIEVNEILEDKIESDDWIVYSYPAIHNSNTKPLCFRLEAEGKTLAYSGDSVESDGLKLAIKNVDLAVIEASWPEEVEPKTHLTGKRAGKIAKEMGVKKLVITHVAPYYLKNFNPQKDAEKTFGKEVILAKDLMTIEI